jgi:hypothetical protein
MRRAPPRDANTMSETRSPSGDVKVLKSTKPGIARAAHSSASAVCS